MLLTDNIGPPGELVNRGRLSFYHKLIAPRRKTGIFGDYEGIPMNRVADVAMMTGRLAEFIRRLMTNSGLPGLVVGLSGGVDSALAAALGVRAAGPDKVLGLIMPYKSSSPESEKDATGLAAKFGFRTERIDISPMIDAYFGGREVSVIRRGNKMARERMSLLFDIAARENSLVLGTSNKTETCLGYATWYGDAASSLNPLGGLYKRDVRAMAEYLGIPREIIDKPPSADLWPGQTDEGELGITYDAADRALYAMIEEGERLLSRLAATAGTDEKTIQAIVARMNRFAYKRALPATDLLGGNPIPEHVELT
jgi:NAD+ synthase